jgi:solute carrier family 25 (adenine nucleotide translocator) protein 4/5/6/31
MQSTKHHSTTTQLAIKAISATCSVVVSHSIHAPFKRIGIIMVTQHANPQLNDKNRYSSSLDVVLRLPREQGWLSFWRGNVPAIIRAIPTLGLNFGLRDYFRHLFSVDAKSGWKNFIGGVIAGGSAGAAALWVTYPLQIARTRMAADIGQNKAGREYTHFTSCIADIYRRDGIKGIYRGFVLSAIGYFLYRGVYFGIYDWLKPIIREKYGESFAHSYLSGWLSTFMSTALVYPVDAVRFRLMMQTGRDNTMYLNARQCAAAVWRSEGVKGFYRGAGYNCFFLSFSGAALLALYDKFQSLF